MGRACCAACMVPCFRVVHTVLQKRSVACRVPQLKGGFARGGFDKLAAAGHCLWCRSVLQVIVSPHKPATGTTWLCKKASSPMQIQCLGPRPWGLPLHGVVCLAALGCFGACARSIAVFWRTMANSRFVSYELLLCSFFYDWCNLLLNSVDTDAFVPGCSLSAVPLQVANYTQLHCSHTNGANPHSYISLLLLL